MRRLERARSAGNAATCVLIGFLLLPAHAWATTVDITAVFPINYEYAPSGFCFHDGAMYAVTKNNFLLRYDPVTGALLEEVAGIVPGQAHLHGITVGAGDTFWIGDVFSQSIYQFRFSDYSVVSSIPAPGVPSYGLAFKGGVLWIGYHSDGDPTPIHGVDPQTGEVLVTFEIGAADVHGLAWLGDYLWVLDNLSDLLHRTTASGAVLETYELPTEDYGAMAHDGSDLWISNFVDFFHIDVPPLSMCPEPGEVLDLGFADRTTLTWAPPLQLGGSPALYDTLRSEDPADFVTVATCVESDDGSDTTAVVDESPLPGEVFHYLVRAENGCPIGEGPLGTNSDDEPREGRFCS